MKSFGGIRREILTLCSFTCSGRMNFMQGQELLKIVDNMYPRVGPRDEYMHTVTEFD